MMGRYAATVRINLPACVTRLIVLGTALRIGLSEFQNS